MRSAVEATIAKSPEGARMVDIDPMEAVEDAQEDDESDGKGGGSGVSASDKEKERRKSRLNSLVAVTVAVLATFLGISEIKDDNINQAMERANADRVDHWSWYQARNIREEVMRSAVVQLQAEEAAGGNNQVVKAAYDQPIANYIKLADEQEQKKNELKAQADSDLENYNALNYRDDQFDLSSALLAISISLLALTSLTQKRWLYALALIPCFFGVLMGVAGLCGVHIHSGLVAKILGT
jgi:hypothetical protein